MADADEPGSKRAKYTLVASGTAVAPSPPPTTTFTWELKDLTLESFTAAQPVELWRSPYFSACGVRWRLYLEPAGVHDGKKAAGLFLHLLEPSCTILLGGATLTCTGRVFELTKLNFSTLDPPPEGAACGCGTANLFPHANLVLSPQNYIPGGVFTVTATLRPRAFDAILPPPEPMPRLALELRALLASGEDADISFEAGDETIRAHSLAVSLQSSTLKGLLRSGPKSSDSRVIKVPSEIRPCIFKQLLEYLYTEEVSLESPEQAQHMLHAADFYGVETLRSRCAAKLCKSLTPSNVLVALTLAHRNSCPDLRTYALRYAAANAAAVLQTAEWTELKRKHPELSDAVTHTMAYGEPPVAIVNEPAAAAGSA